MNIKIKSLLAILLMSGVLCAAQVVTVRLPSPITIAENLSAMEFLGEFNPEGSEFIAALADQTKRPESVVGIVSSYEDDLRHLVAAVANAHREKISLQESLHRVACIKALMVQAVLKGNQGAIDYLATKGLILSVEPVMQENICPNLPKSPASPFVCISPFMDDIHADEVSASS